MRKLLLDVVREGLVIPAVAWLPEASTPAPVVLLGHGGSGHKNAERHLRMARHLAEHSGLASIAIDGPFHGDRASPDSGPLDYQQRVIDEGPSRVHEAMCADWLAALDASGGLVDATRVGYFGLSMGARYGIPTCAALGSRLRVAVFGKFGLRSDGIMQRVAADGLIRESAGAITVPTLLHVPWDDEVFPRAGQFELFELIGSPDKVLHARPGAHGSNCPQDEAFWCQFLARHLADSTV